MTNKNNYCRFYLARHGETVWNVEHIMQGHSDSPLTDNGINQAKEVAEKLRGVQFAQVFSSDLMRSQRTAEIISADHDLVVKTNRLLREYSLGPFEGKKLSYFLETLKKAIAYRDSLADELRLSHQLHPEVETEENSALRLITFFRETAFAYPGKNILAVSHAGTIRALLVKLGYATNDELPHGAVKNTSYVVLDCDGVDFFVRETVGIEKTKLL
ncbi:MAG: histidine phosphatase family protein [bacterium]|nr:histidine phosphatase family protein [bacterium]